jgi:ribosome hibernation promoting factor
MTVEVSIFGRNMDVTDRIQDYVTKKVSKLDRYISGIEEARVDLSYVKSARNVADRQVAQITIRGNGFILRSEESADDIFAALDVALDKVQRQIERYKGKRNRGRGDGVSLARASADTDDSEGEMEIWDEGAPFIARRKKFLLVPMDEMEAIEQMNLLGHQTFFVYYDINKDAVNVLYTRRDGSYGLIETEIG